MFTENKNFYPTPEPIIKKMLDKISFTNRFDMISFNKGIKNILEPSAGKGDILKYIEKVAPYNNSIQIDCIEKDENLFKYLIGDKRKVIDRDFLTFESSKFYDAILMNPPFDAGASHLLKAIDLMYSGDIVCILNAETLRNTYSNERKLLVEKLRELNADIEYIENAFIDAERKTGVEIVLIHIKKESDLEVDLFEGVSEGEKDTIEIDETESTEISLSENNIETLVKNYNEVINSGKSCLIDYYTKHYKHIGHLIGIGFIRDTIRGVDGSINDLLKSQYNKFLDKTRKKYWGEVLALPAITRRLSSKGRDNFEKNLAHMDNMEFTTSNIRQVIINIINAHPNLMIDDAERLFDDITRNYSYSKDTDKNRLHFDKWKTNAPFKVNNKFIIPFGDGVFSGYRGWELSWREENALNDIDNILNYIAGYESLGTTVDAVKTALKEANATGERPVGESSFFSNIKINKKGTVHFTFRDPDVLRKFNIIACKKKGWLPNEYGYKDYADCTPEEKTTIDEFDGKETYVKNMSNPPQFGKNKALLQLTS